jgi:hypothetical protein
MELTKEDKEMIKTICKTFHAQQIKIDGINVNLPKDQDNEKR